MKLTGRTVAVIGLCAVAAAMLVAGGASASAGKKAAGGQVCVLLPDTATSIRWVHYDTPALKASLKAAGVTSQFYNANDDAQTQKTQANQCIGNGAKVIIEVALDAGSASAIEKQAKAKGIPSIDYDRQVIGGVASIYVSFDGKAVGVLQGQGIVNGLKAAGKYGSHPVVAELNGGSTDANSFLFKGGYDSVLKPLYANGTFKKGPDQFVPGWDNQKAATIFNQMLVKTGNKIDAVAAANDGIASSVVADLKAHNLKPIPLSGQDATPQGLQYIIAGWQTMTVWKDTRVLAKDAAAAAVSLIKGTALKTTGTVPNGKAKEPAFIIPPVALTKANWTQIYKSGFIKKSDVCSGAYAKYCK
ncbi:MAG TPA: substrate-binding domain-containing protein [Gaiellaceae bacterium]|nr:substrate-binding domain-containing protein [Gaiellaceae bacterium]